MKNPFDNYRNSRFIIADENDPHYPIRGLSDLVSLRDLCREKTDSPNSEIESISAENPGDGPEEFNQRNKVNSLTSELENFEAVLKLIEIDLEVILRGAVRAWF